MIIYSSAVTCFKTDLSVAIDAEDSLGKSFRTNNEITFINLSDLATFSSHS